MKTTVLPDFIVCGHYVTTSEGREEIVVDIHHDTDPKRPDKYRLTLEVQSGSLHVTHRNVDPETLKPLVYEIPDELKPGKWIEFKDRHLSITSVLPMRTHNDSRPFFALKAQFFKDSKIAPTPVKLVRFDYRLMKPLENCEQDDEILNAWMRSTAQRNFNDRHHQLSPVALSAEYPNLDVVDIIMYPEAPRRKPAP